MSLSKFILWGVLTLGAPAVLAAPLALAPAGDAAGFVATYLVEKRPDLSYEAFRAHQLDVHAPLVEALAGLRDYRVRFFPPAGDASQPFDAMAQVRFDSAAAHAAALASQEGAQALADLPNYLDTAALQVLASGAGDRYAADEAAGDAAGFVATYLVEKRPDLSFEAFRAHQLDVHAPLVLALPGLRDYRVSFFAPTSEGPQPFDAMAQVYFDSAAAHAAALASEAGAQALADLPNYLDAAALLVLASGAGDRYVAGPLAPIPLPGSALLLLGALGALVAARRRR